MTTTLDTRPARCPRCERRLMDEHGDAVCLDHGTVWTPIRPWDVQEADLIREDKRPQAPNAGRPWSAKDRHYVIHNRDRMSSKEMARRLGRTEHSINQLLHKAGVRKARARNLSQVREPADTLEQLEDQARPGMFGALARRYGFTYRAAYLRLYRRGVLLREADGMLSVSEVMRHYGCTRHRVERLIGMGILTALHTSRTTMRLDPAEVEQAAPYLRARSKHHPRRKPL